MISKKQNRKMEWHEKLDSIPKVGFINPERHLTFAYLFALNFLKNMDYFVYKSFITRSNWTQITANSFLETCKTLMKTCEFEVINRHDGIVRNQLGEIEICAEWEYATETIFGQKGEIVKLLKSQKKFKNCEALLLTYCETEEYESFLGKVYTEYNQALPKGKDYRIVLSTALLDTVGEDKPKEISCIRIVEIGREYAYIYGDVSVEKQF